MKKIEFTMTAGELQGFTEKEIADTRWGIEQAFASSILEGRPYPTTEEIRLLELVAFGKITEEEFEQKTLQRIGIV